MRFKITPLVIALTLLLCACRQSAQSTPTPETASPDDLVITLEVEPAPPVVGDTTLVISVQTAAGALVSDASVVVRGDMNHAGMSPVFGETDGGTEGIYRVPFEWTMGGDWIITIDVSVAGRETISRSFELSVQS